MARLERNLVRSIVDGVTRTIGAGADAGDRMMRGEALPGDEACVEKACRLSAMLAEYFAPKKERTAST